MNVQIFLFYMIYTICCLTGAGMVIGGVWLIYKEKIYLNPDTKEVLSVELPFFGKFRTNVPALGLFVIGIMPLIYSLYKLTLTTPYIQVEQMVTSDDHPVAVYVAVGSKSVPRDSTFRVSVPVINNPDYTPELVYLAGPVIDHVEINLDEQKDGQIVLQAEQLQNINKTPGASITPDVVPKPSGF